MEKNIRSEHVHIWGPPGAGKTTLLVQIASKLKGIFIDMSTKNSIIDLALYLLAKTLKKSGETTETIKKTIENITKNVDLKTVRGARTLLSLIRAQIYELAKQTQTYLIFDAMDQLPEELEEGKKDTTSFYTLIKLLKDIPNLKILTSSRRREGLGFKTIYIEGFTEEEAQKYLKEYNPTLDTIKMLPHPILPIYLHYFKKHLKDQKITEISLDMIGNLPKTVEEWHETFWTNFTEKQKILLMLMAVLPGPPNIEAIAHTLKNKEETEIEKIKEVYKTLEELKDFLKEDKTIFHPLFQEYVEEKIKQQAPLIKHYTEKLVEYLHKNNEIEEEIETIIKAIQLKIATHKIKNQLLKTYPQTIELLYIKGQYNKLLKILKHTLPIHKELGNKLGMASDLGNMGLVLMDLGKPREALEKFEQAYEIDKELGNKLGMANQLGNMGLVLMDLGKPREALEKFEQAYEIDKELGNKLGMASDLGNMGLVLRQLGKPREALKYHKQAYKIVRDNYFVLAFRLLSSGVRVSLDCGFWSDCLCFSFERLRYVAEHLKDLGEEYFRKVWYDLVGLLVRLLELGEFEVLLEYVDRFVDFFAEINERNFALFFSVIRRIAENRGKIDEEVLKSVEEFDSRSSLKNLLKEIIRLLKGKDSDIGS
nr:tetratricopeptide repeat protein [Candidatus Baldrarchaeota archaeon]